MKPPPLDPVAALVRRHDPDRFFTALFAPAQHRDTLLLLYAFNHELARAREVASAPPLALIRLHWWREVAQGTRRRHEVAGPLGAALDRGDLPGAALEALVDAREAEVEAGFATTEEWETYLRGTAGALAVLAARVLGAEGAVLGRLERLGIAYAMAGHLRSVAALARQERCLLPYDLLAAHGLSAELVIADPMQPALRPVLAGIAARGRALLREAGGSLPRPLLAAGLTAVLARRDFARVQPAPTSRSFGDKAAVSIAALLGRV